MDVTKLAPGELITISRAAQLLAVSRRTIYRFINEGQLKVVRVGQRSTRVERQSLAGVITQASD